MKKWILLIIIVLLSGCIDNKLNYTKENEIVKDGVKIGDTVSVDFMAISDGKIFDTSTEKIAVENNLTKKQFKPVKFKVGEGKAIRGIEEGIIGMKLGESKILTIPPEKGYGQIDPKLIQTIPRIKKIPVERTFLKDFEIPFGEFNSSFGSHKISDNVQMPGTNVNLTIIDINTTSNVRVSQNLTVGYEVVGLAPWKETVIKIDDKNVTAKSEAKKNDIVKLKYDLPWNTTVIDIDSDNITLRHNSIPDTKIRILDEKNLSYIRIHFNDTYITMDRNAEYAGETLVFNVTVRSIN